MSEKAMSGIGAKRCKVAFVGAGYMSTEHIRAFKDVEGVELCGIFSRTLARAEQLAADFGIALVCQSIEELYEKTCADLVVISVPELSTRGVVEKCFAYPWTLLIEKPVGYNLDEAESIAKSAHALKRTAYVALNRRHYSSTQAVRQELDHTAEQRFIHVQDQADLHAAREFGQPELVIQNWMYANSIHVIDYLTMLGRGDVVEVLPLFSWDAKKPGYVAAKIVFESGDLGLYQAVWNAPGPWAVAVTTHAKRWEMRPLEQATYQLNGQRKLEPMPIHPWDQAFKPGLRRQAELAVRAATGGDATGLPTLDDALKSMRLAQAIYKV